MYTKVCLAKSNHVKAIKHGQEPTRHGAEKNGNNNSFEYRDKERA